MRKEEFKRQLESGILLSDFWNKGELILFKLEKTESLEKSINELVEDIATMYNIKNLQFLSIDAVDVQKSENSFFYSIKYKIILHYDVKNYSFSSMVEFYKNFYVFEEDYKTY